jgi:hypothetical protein
MVLILAAQSVYFFTRGGTLSSVLQVAIERAVTVIFAEKMVAIYLSGGGIQILGFTDFASGLYFQIPFQFLDLTSIKRNVLSLYNLYSPTSSIDCFSHPSFDI